MIVFVRFPKNQFCWWAYSARVTWYFQHSPCRYLIDQHVPQFNILIFRQIDSFVINELINFFQIQCTSWLSVVHNIHPTLHNTWYIFILLIVGKHFVYSLCFIIHRCLCIVFEKYFHCLFITLINSWLMMEEGAAWAQSIHQ